MNNESPVVAISRKRLKASDSFTANRPTLLPVLKYENQALIFRLQRKEGMSEAEAKEAFMDTLRFLYLCAQSPKPLAPSRRIDAVWHHFILFTKAYADFCQKYFGKFIHHVPNEARLMSMESAQSKCSNCSNCSDCNGDGKGRALEFSERPATLEDTLRVARTRFGLLSSNWN